MTAPQKEPAGSEREAFEAWAADQGFMLTRTVHGDDYQDLRTQGPWDAWQARASQPSGAAGEVTDAMVDAYLKANDAYWKRTDELPKSGVKWRNGTPREATRESLAAALRASLASPSSGGWMPIESAPQDENILIAATPDWVMEARQDLNDDGGEQVWQWVSADGRLLHKSLVPVAWMPKPAFPTAFISEQSHG